MKIDNDIGFDAEYKRLSIKQRKKLMQIVRNATGWSYPTFWQKQTRYSGMTYKEHLIVEDAFDEVNQGANLICNER